jgi:3-oxoacyl-[acyl-carrier protein] reductase
VDLGIGGRGALVCGSTQGMGRAIAARLAVEGCRVAVNGRDRARTAAAAATLARDSGGTVVAAPGDVSDPAAVGALVAHARAQLGAVDILVCNAGTALGAVCRRVRGQWRRQRSGSTCCPPSLCRNSVPAMRRRGWGRVVCLTSVAAKQALAGLILSTTARAGVLNCQDPG